MEPVVEPVLVRVAARDALRLAVDVPVLVEDALAVSLGEGVTDAEGLPVPDVEAVPDLLGVPGTYDHHRPALHVFVLKLDTAT